MKRNYVYISRFALIGAIVLIGFVSVFSQSAGNDPSFYAEELRPFDFSDKHYQSNGVEPLLIVNRRSGADGQSVFDTTYDRRFRNVRILGVYPAYNQHGKIVYWNHYGEVFKHGFTSDAIGERAREIAHLYPLYIFPSKEYEYEFRQAHVINMRDDGYFTKNPLGLGVQVIVEYTTLIHTKEGQKEMTALIKKNGLSSDGTPVIKTALEIEDLTKKNYITQKIKGTDNPAHPDFVIAGVLQNPQDGAIAPDAFLNNSLGVKVDPSFSYQFECLQTAGKWCSR